MAVIIAANSNDGPTSAITLQREEGGSLVNINPTGVAYSVNDLAVADIYDFINTRIQAASTINNYGTLTGNLNLGGGEDVFTNYSSNSWNVRNFSVSGDPAVRDTENVALSDFGSGNDVFTNTASGTVRLRSEEHTSELQSLMRISYAVFCLK